MIVPVVVYEDAHLLVVNKPCGLNSDTDNIGNPSVELWVKKYYAGKKQIQPVLMHRLDRVASGLLLISKKPATTKQLQYAFEHRKIEKKYLAVVHSCNISPSGTLKHFLRKDFVQKKSAVVHSSELGQEAILKYKLLQQVEMYSLLEIDLLTGRYHQIRAQLSAAGCPIVGDRIYGSKVDSGIETGIALHAHYLKINHVMSEKKRNWKQLPPKIGVWKLFFN
ncbi:MAG: RNA pseudouridine synthase [Flavobacteriales bacterium]|nr:RNA pseudouridine synthase [Flavobacteriales bacterium]